MNNLLFINPAILFYSYSLLEQFLVSIGIMMDDLMSNTGNPSPLGATWERKGTNFALYFENADAVDLCLFNAIEDDSEYIKVRIRERSHHVWQIFLPGIGPGQLYGYRVHGAYSPGEGHRFNLSSTLPPEKFGENWEMVFDTETGKTRMGEVFQPLQKLVVASRSVVLLQNENKGKNKLANESLPN